MRITRNRVLNTVATLLVVVNSAGRDHSVVRNHYITVACAADWVESGGVDTMVVGCISSI
jgi:hypothetical protein